MVGDDGEIERSLVSNLSWSLSTGSRIGNPEFTLRRPPLHGTMDCLMYSQAIVNGGLVPRERCCGTKRNEKKIDRSNATLGIPQGYVYRTRTEDIVGKVVNPHPLAGCKDDKRRINQQRL